MRPLAVYIVVDAALARQPNSLDRITLGFVGQGARERGTKAKRAEHPSRTEEDYILPANSTGGRRAVTGSNLRGTSAEFETARLLKKVSEETC